MNDIQEGKHWRFVSVYSNINLCCVYCDSTQLTALDTYLCISSILYLFIVKPNSP